ncbi:MAG: S16 family serine protease [Acidimicrobiia bacterium]|nr:S16 family serine protease [Acidimicrobiia bacterium]
MDTMHHHVDEAAPTPVPRMPRWPFVVAAVALLLGVAVVILWPLKVPYFAMAPGPTEEVVDLLSVPDGVETHDPSGEFFLLTVGLREVNVFEYIEAQFDPKVSLIDRHVIRPEGVTQEEVTRTNLEAMDRSIDSAIFVALDRAGYDVGFTGEGAVVIETVEGAPADGVLLPDDVVDTVEGETVVLSDDAARVIREFEPGDTITLGGVRDGERFSVEITLVPHPDIEGAPMVGVLFDTKNLEMVLPVDIQIDSRNIGGPSAGITYTLALLDLLLEEDLSKGHRIASTGTIALDETVGPIGGVRQKVFAAKAIGAEYVLVPEANFDDALGAADGEIEIVSVATLDDALAFLRTLEPAPEAVAAP